MSRYTIGIDPGQKGAVAVHDPRSGWTVEVMDAIDAHWFLHYSQGRAHAVIEKAQAMPGQGVSSMFNYGMGFGKLLGWLEGYRIPYTLVTPAMWTKELHVGCTGEAKQKSLQAAKRLFPDINLLATPRSKKPHEGLIDALLIAEWGRRNIK